MPSWTRQGLQITNPKILLQQGHGGPKGVGTVNRRAQMAALVGSVMGVRRPKVAFLMNGLVGLKGVMGDLLWRLWW